MRLLKSLFITLVMLAGMVLAAGLVYWATTVFFNNFILWASGVVAVVFLVVWIVVYMECDD